MSKFLWIILLVLFSLPSLLGKKDKRGKVHQKHVESEPYESDSADDTNIEKTLRRVFGQEVFADTQKPRPTQAREQFLYNEYNPEEVEEEPLHEATVQPATSPLREQEDPATSTNFNIRDAVIYSVILENPYIDVK